MNIVLRDGAIADLESIHAWIAAKRPWTAQRVIGRILDSIENLASFPELDRAAFARSAAILAAQRNCKIIGIFTRLWRRDGKPAYLAHIPRVWRLLEDDLRRETALRPIADWLDRHLPPEVRRASAAPPRQAGAA